MSRGFERLMDEVARQHDDELATGDEVAEVRARLARPRRSRSSRPRLAILAVAACVVAAPLLWMAWPRPQALTYTVGAQNEPAAAGRWIQVEASAPEVPLRFSDGSRLDLQPDSDLEVAALHGEGAHVRLVRGRVEASVEHRADSRWTIDAGPFEVAVVGTRFRVHWDPVPARFELVMHEGAVVLTGPLVEERHVVAPARLEISLRDGRVELHAGGPDPEEVRDAPLEAASVEVERDEAAPTRSEPPADPDAPAAGAAVDAPEAPASESADAPAVGFDRHARAGRYDEALRAAEHAGWSQTLNEAPVRPLLRLADAARLASRPGRAREAYEAVRRRFAFSPHSARAAFSLGRLAHDGAGDPAIAARWFATYLREAPHGELAREAAGRLIEARVDASDTAGARAAAARYLRSYPNGPHAELARSLQERP